MTPAILILTVLTSAIAAGAVTYFLNVSKERLFFIGRKSEDLYCTVEALDAEISSFYAKRYALVGSSDHPAGSENLHRANGHFATARMLVGLYFPALSLDLARAGAAAATAQRSLDTLEHAAEANPGHLLEALDAAVCDLKDSLDALKSAILTRGPAGKGRALFGPSKQRQDEAHVRRVLQVQA